MTWWRLVWRLLTAVVALLIVLGKVAVTARWVPANPGLESAALFFGGILVFSDSVASILSTFRRKAQMDQKHDAEKAVLASLRTIAGITSIDLAVLGGSVFVPHRGKLQRLVRVRISDSPQKSEVAWVAGKGAIGAAWKERRIIHMNWKPIADRYGAGNFTREQFEKVSPKTRAGFTYPEFRGIVSKYAEVLAVPIWKGEKLVGVLSLDVPMTVTHTNLGKCLQSKAVEEIASSCANVLSDVVG